MSVESVQEHQGRISLRQAIVQRSGRAFFYLSMLAAILPAGAANPFFKFLFCTLTGTTAAIAALTPSRASSVRRKAAAAIALLLLLVLAATLQASAFPDNPFAHPIWKRAGSLLGEVTPAISVEPAATREALLTLAAPFLIYLSALALFDSDERALTLMRFLAGVGTSFAVFGLI